MFRRIACSVFALSLIACGDIASAQIVRIGGFGGVRVRAPFVSVDVLPYGGGARVRAPFTSVNTGAYGYGPVYYGHRHPYHPPVTIYDPRPPVAVLPVLPVPAVVPVPAVGYPVAPAPVYAQPVSPVVAATLSEQLRASAARLAQSLSYRRSDANVWLDYLGPQLIVDAIDRGDDPASLRGLVRNYDGVVGNGSLGSIRSASGFSETRALLKQYVSRPAQVAKPVAPEPRADRVPDRAPDPAPEPAPAEDTEPILPPQPVLPPQPILPPQPDDLRAGNNDVDPVRTAAEEQPTPL